MIAVDQDLTGCELATDVRPVVEQPNRKGSQINHATSRGIRGQSRDQNQSQTGL